MGEGKPERARQGRRTGRAARILAVLLAIPAAYLIAALAGSLISVNAHWTEPQDGITIYLADNGIHTDIVMPASAAGVDWAPLLADGGKASAGWVAFGSGEEHVYLDTPTWWDIRPRTIWAVLTGSRRVLHVEWVGDPSYAERAIRLRPDEYRRLWTAIRSDFQLGRDGSPIRIDHPGYGAHDSFYRQTGRFNALSSCNVWVADKLRIAGVKTSLWPPFAPGLSWRYRPITARSG